MITTQERLAGYKRDIEILMLQKQELEDAKNEFEENRKLAPEYAENAAKKLEADAKKFYGEVQNVL